MSVTTTSNAAVYNTLYPLADYNLHHSGDDAQPTDHSLNPRDPPPASPTASSNNPIDWPTDYRRVPPHRPIDRTLDHEQRPAGQNMGEFILINVMLNGVRLNANVSRLWRSTGGRINDRIFRYPIGGEW